MFILLSYFLVEILWAEYYLFLRTFPISPGKVKPPPPHLHLKDFWKDCMLYTYWFMQESPPPSLLLLMRLSFPVWYGKGFSCSQDLLSLCDNKGGRTEKLCFWLKVLVQKNKFNSQH
jgi:hypothetical protein